MTFFYRISPASGDPWPAARRLSRSTIDVEPLEDYGAGQSALFNATAQPNSMRLRRIVVVVRLSPFPARLLSILVIHYGLKMRRLVHPVCAIFDERQTRHPGRIDTKSYGGSWFHSEFRSRLVFLAADSFASLRPTCDDSVSSRLRSIFIAFFRFAWLFDRFALVFFSPFVHLH